MNPRLTKLTPTIKTEQEGEVVASQTATTEMTPLRSPKSAENAVVMEDSDIEHNREQLPIKKKDDQHTKNKTTISLAMIAGIAISWTFATQFGKSLLQADKQHFYAPFGVIWFKTTFMIFCYPIYLVYTCLFTKQPLARTHAEATTIYSPNGIELKPFLFKELTLTALWTLANYSFLSSLGRISASAATSIMSSNAAMVCIFSWILLRDKFSFLKSSACVFAILGVTVISTDQEFVGDIFGVCLALGGALFSAIYKVVFKKINGNATLGQVSLFMSCLGLVNIPMNAGPAVALVASKKETVVWEYLPWKYLLTMAVLSMVFNFLLNFGVALLNPLVVTIGMLCGIPLSAAVDICFRGMPLTKSFLIGSILIIISFVITAFPIEDALKHIVTAYREQSKREDIEGEISEREKQ